jgi:undecaprenyl-diphosphatase
VGAGHRLTAVLLATGGLLAGGAMAIALIVKSGHYPSDTVGGFCAAVVAVLGAALLVDRVVDRHARS